MNYNKFILNDSYERKRESNYKIVYTLWTKPFFSKKNQKNQNKIISKIKNFYLLSFLYIKKIHNGNVELATDAYGKSILKDIPYDRVILFDKEMEDVNPLIWSYAKIKTIDLYDEPIIHVDGDLILTKTDYAKEVFNSNYDLICQGFEYGSHYENFYRKNMQRFMDVCHLSPRYDFLNYFNLVYNTGILGFKNLKFKKTFCESYFSLIKEIDANKLNKFLDMKRIYKEYGYLNHFWIDPNCYIEQSLLSSLSIMNNLYAKAFTPTSKTKHFSQHATFINDETGLIHWAGPEKWTDKNIHKYVNKQLKIICKQSKCC